MKPSEMSIRLGKNMKNVRKMRGLSVHGLSEIIGMTDDAIRKYERGERSLSVEDMIRFAQLLQCDPQNFTRGLFRQNDDDEQQEIEILTTYEHGVFMRMSTEFRKRKKALIIADDLYMMLPAEREREVILTLAMQTDAAIQAGELSVDDLPEEMEHLRKALGGLYDL